MVPFPSWWEQLIQATPCRNLILLSASDRVDVRFTLPAGTSITRPLPGRETKSTARADDALRVLDGIDPLPLYLRDADESAFIARLPERDAVLDAAPR